MKRMIMIFNFLNLISFYCRFGMLILNHNLIE
jgi:hypothetical protein